MMLIGVHCLASLADMWMCLLQVYGYRPYIIEQKPTTGERWKKNGIILFLRNPGSWFAPAISWEPLVISKAGLTRFTKMCRVAAGQFMEVSTPSIPNTLWISI
jgi:hypothetical protein